ncbi:MAG TPA: extracellular solute-binding protein [Candidatus Binatia bacterium]|jgi:ABC-type Fe3+ transport system substrate-binding protein
MRNSRKRSFTVAAILAFAAATFAMPLRAAEDLTASARREGELNLYLSTDLSDANAMIQAYKKKYPFVEVSFFRAGNEKLLSRILTESATGKFTGDVILISSFEVRVLMQKRLLQKYLSLESANYPEGFTDKEGYWTSVYSIPRVIAYNTRLVRPEAAPKSYDDLLQPRWKNGFALSDSAVLWYTGFLKFNGEEKGREFMKKLAAQKPAFRDSESIITQLLAAGEFPLGLTYSHQVGTFKRRGAPVDWVHTAQPIVTGLKPIALSAKAAHPAAGKLFIDFVLSREGQELIRSFNRISGRSDVASEMTAGAKLYPADPRWGDSYGKYVEEFREIFFK